LHVGRHPACVGITYTRMHELCWFAVDLFPRCQDSVGRTPVACGS
jgi:hypothetical protein